MEGSGGFSYDSLPLQEGVVEEARALRRRGETGEAITMLERYLTRWYEQQRVTEEGPQEMIGIETALRAPGGPAVAAAQDYLRELYGLHGRGDG